jgi:hypothetical protein
MSLDVSTHGGEIEKVRPLAIVGHVCIRHCEPLATTCSIAQWVDSSCLPCMCVQRSACSVSAEMTYVGASRSPSQGNHSDPREESDRDAFVPHVASTVHLSLAGTAL